MIDIQDILEVRKRDFLAKQDHYRDFDTISTDLVLGNRQEREIFLSIIVPVYNHPISFIKRAINSALNQHCDYLFEMIVIDDYIQNKGEKSETEKFLRDINDTRIIYYKNRSNLGVFANWNRGIELAKGKWITILHTDDFFKDNFLQNMKNILDEHPEIDQLACNYKLLNFKKNNIDIKKEYRGSANCAIVRKVKYTEYLYEMKTSVKGSFYKRKTLLDIGGFRSQGDGIGLDDYPLMMRYAYYYNTYLVEDVLYLDSWGYNDSLNPKHWYPELVENYYMWLYFAKRELPIIRNIYKTRAKYLLKKRAIQYKNGTSWIGIPINIDMEQLKNDCEIDFMNGNKIEEIISTFLVKCFNYVKKHPYRKFRFNIKSYKSIKKLE